MPNINITKVKFCAFCSYWWDPACSCIEPKTPKSYIWEYKHGKKNMCLQKNILTASQMTCSNYRCKIPEL